MSGRAALTLSPGQMAEVETLAAVLNAEQIADYFGIGRTTFFAMIRRDAEIGERYKKGKARAVGAIAQGLIQKARSGDTTSMIFYLKTQGGWRETLQIERHDEWAREALDISQLSDEDLLRMIGVLDTAIQRACPSEAGAIAEEQAIAEDQPVVEAHAVVGAQAVEVER